MLPIGISVSLLGTGITPSKLPLIDPSTWISPDVYTFVAETSPQ